MTLYVALAAGAALIYWAYRSRGSSAAASSADPSMEAARVVVGNANILREDAIIKEAARRMATAPEVAAEVDRIFAPLAPRPQAPAAPAVPKEPDRP